MAHRVLCVDCKHYPRPLVGTACEDTLCDDCWWKDDKPNFKPLEENLPAWDQPAEDEAGAHDDAHKVRLDLIPPEVLYGIGLALTYGKFKYGEANFKKGISYTRLIGSVLRHITKFMGNEDDDPESLLSHVDHAMASLGMLKWMTVHRPDLDDREHVTPPELFTIPQHMIEHWLKELKDGKSSNRL